MGRIVEDFLDEVHEGLRPVDHEDLNEALDGMVNRDDLLEAVRKLRSFVEEQDRKHVSSLRQEMAELKSIAGSPSGGTSGLMAAGLVQLEKRLDSDVTSWQSRHAKALQETSGEVSELRSSAAHLEEGVATALECISDLHQRLVELESAVASLPALLQGLLGALPIPQVSLPADAIRVLVDQVAPIVNVSTPRRKVKKTIKYDESSRPSEIEETEEDADSDTRSVLDPNERERKK